MQSISPPLSNIKYDDAVVKNDDEVVKFDDDFNILQVGVNKKKQLNYFSIILFYLNQKLRKIMNRIDTYTKTILYIIL